KFEQHCGTAIHDHKTSYNWEKLSTNHRISFLKYKIRNYHVDIRKKELQQRPKKISTGQQQFRRMNYHCCKCGRPAAKVDTNDRWKWGYNQLCNSCSKAESYDIT
ncbi:1480_t:CDS:1, partial [Entrophospora sp. SA101]